jgi:hypothetical protein
LQHPLYPQTIPKPRTGVSPVSACSYEGGPHRYSALSLPTYDLDVQWLNTPV